MDCFQYPSIRTNSNKTLQVTTKSFLMEEMGGVQIYHLQNLQLLLIS
jgi:hypothetical protein